MTDAFNAPGVVRPFGIFSGAAWQPEGRVPADQGRSARPGRHLGLGQNTRAPELAGGWGMSMAVERLTSTSGSAPTPRVA